MAILEFDLSHKKTKIRNRTHLLKFKRGENVKSKEKRTSSQFFWFLQREGPPSL